MGLIIYLDIENIIKIRLMTTYFMMFDTFYFFTKFIRLSFLTLKRDQEFKLTWKKLLIIFWQKEFRRG